MAIAQNDSVNNLSDLEDAQAPYTEREPAPDTELEAKEESKADSVPNETLQLFKILTERTKELAESQVIVKMKKKDNEAQLQENLVNG
jgi:hypothetical protein